MNNFIGDGFMTIIKKCKVCQKKGVFLKLYKGLCQKCESELKFLEEYYYELKSIIDDNSEITDPNKVIEQANIILDNIDKFQNTYTPIRKELCLEVISLMENLLDDEKIEDKLEPIYFNPESYEDEKINSPESTLNTITKESSEEDDETQISEECNETKTLNESNYDTNLKIENNIVLENTDSELKEAIDNIDPLIKENKKIEFTITKNIVLDEDKIKDINLEIEETKTIIDNSNKDNKFSEIKFDNISFEEESPKIKNQMKVSSDTIDSLDTDDAKILTDTSSKTDVTETLSTLKELLDEIDETLSKSKIKDNLTEDIIKNNKSEIKISEKPSITSEIENTSTISDIETNIITQEEKIDELDELNANINELKPVENKSTETLALECILKLNDTTITPEEKGYTIEVLKNYSSELYKKEIYKLDNIDLKKFIDDKEKKLLKEINKASFELFNFFNYVSFSISKESDEIYILSAVKVCYGKIIDTFYSKYSIENSSNELELLEDVAYRFSEFIGKMNLITHNANFNISTLKSSFSKVKNVYINNKFICTRNSYLKLCSKLSIPKPPTIDLYACLKHFLSDAEIEEINEESSNDLLDSIKTFKLYEKLKYLI